MTIGPQVIRPAAVGLCALADQARQARAAVPSRAGRRSPRLTALIRGRQGGGSYPAHPDSRSASTGAAGWPGQRQNCAAPQRRQRPGRLAGRRRHFGPAFVYETARSRWRLAEALAEAGDRDEAQRQWLLAAADGRGTASAPRPLRAALADLAAGPGSATGRSAGGGGPRPGGRGAAAVIRWPF